VTRNATLVKRTGWTSIDQSQKHRTDQRKKEKHEQLNQANGDGGGGEKEYAMYLLLVGRKRKRETMVCLRFAFNSGALVRHRWEMELSKQPRR